MGRRGWAGTPPRDDDDARRLILEATVRCVQRSGPARTNLSDVAAELAITRKTVYRYFASTEDLFTAVVESSIGHWVARMRAVTRAIDDPVDMIVEAVAFVIEQLPHEELLILLLTSGRADVFSRHAVSDASIARSRGILLDSRIDWVGLGFTERDLDELVEFLLRIIQSMVVAPPERPRTAAELRGFLRRWVAPDLAAYCTGATDGAQEALHERQRPSWTTGIEAPAPVDQGPRRP